MECDRTLAVAVTSIIKSIRAEYLRYKALAEAAFEQLSEAELSKHGPNDANSIAVICWHVSENFRSHFGAGSCEKRHMLKTGMQRPLSPLSSSAQMLRTSTFAIPRLAVTTFASCAAKKFRREGRCVSRREGSNH